MFIVLQKFVENICNLFTVITFVLKNALITTCYCADDEKYYYKITRSINATENQYHIYFEARAYDETYTPISTTKFTFSFSKRGINSAFLGLTFREQMRALLNIFRNTNGKIPPNLNKILLMTTFIVSGVLYVTGKSMAQFFREAKKHNKENLGITDFEKQDKPFFYISFSKDDEIEVLQGIYVFRYFKRNWYSNSSEQSQHLVDNEIQVSEPITLDSSSVENICRTSTSDAAIADLGQSFSQYVEPLLRRSISRQLSNVEREAVDLYQEMFQSPLNSLIERHTTSFNFTMYSVLEVNNSFYTTH